MMLELGDPLTEEEIEEFFAAVDVDNDGTMSYEEFVEFLRKDVRASAHFPRPFPPPFPARISSSPRVVVDCSCGRLRRV